ncbi:MAG: MetQ/NlpA family ABC transporter substrate-binding protein, partial [Limosilactobacillus sp.]|nr:MetQ/NlpA family ABC transporter substrate-binding protein [Limosilactobacillus sp.]
MKKHWKVWSLVAVLIVAIGGWFGYRHEQAAKTTTVKIGLVGTDSQPVWNDVKKRLAKDHIKIEYVTFNDY